VIWWKVRGYADRADRLVDVDDDEFDDTVLSDDNVNNSDSPDACVDGCFLLAMVAELLLSFWFALAAVAATACLLASSSLFMRSAAMSFKTGFNGVSLLFNWSMAAFK
jgi:hypothetical protein